jgi:HKD family nuclease
MKYLTMTSTMLAILGSAVVLSSFVTTSAFAQDEEYMQKHDGADRAEYLQEMENSDPEFYVPPVNDASFPVANNTSSN